MIKHVEIYTDGACSGNPGPGGYAAILVYGQHEKIVSGSEKHTTNNRMELQAAISALKILNQQCRVLVTTDSKYVMRGMSEWIEKWKRNDWRTSDNSPVKNADLWKELDTLAAKHFIEWKWVKGHSTHAMNNRVDGLAKDAVLRTAST